MTATLVVVGVRIVGVLFVKVTAVVLSFATVLPFASRSVPLIDVVAAPSAAKLVLLVEQLMLDAAPKTVIVAEAVWPPAVATTEQGCVAEFVAVETKRPACVTAPQPPVTEKATVEPAAAPLVVNCCWPPTGRAAEVGEMVSVVAAAAGVVLTWK